MLLNDVTIDYIVCAALNVLNEPDWIAKPNFVLNGYKSPIGDWINEKWRIGHKLISICNFDSND